MTNFFDFAISGLPDASAVGRRLPPSEIDRLLQTGAFAAALRLLAGSFITLYEGSPDITALFATRQSRLLCHALLALYFQKRKTGAPIRRKAGRWRGAFTVHPGDACPMVRRPFSGAGPHR